MSPRSSRRGGRPHRLAEALRGVRDEMEPQTLLAATQARWPAAVGERIAAHSRPISERDGVVTIACGAATWAQELDLLQEELLTRLNAALETGGAGAVRGLRFVATPPGD
jgi:predicted nucleic acid-binding Zn ribbon protein